MNENLAVLSKILDPADNSTGGGAACAIAGAMAAGLAGMVARLSIGKEGMQPDEFYEERNAEFIRLSSVLLEGARIDSEAFTNVQSSFRLPKDTEEQKSARREAIQNAWIEATEVPLGNAELCAVTLELAQGMVGRSNINVASDLTCGLYLARAGGLGCLDNVEINLGMIRDEATVASLAARAQMIKERLS